MRPLSPCGRGTGRRGLSGTAVHQHMLFFICFDQLTRMNHDTSLRDTNNQRIATGRERIKFGVVYYGAEQYRQSRNKT
jgi:hypothetical protein